MKAKEFLKIALGGNMNINTLTVLAFTEIMEDYARLKMIEENKSILEMAKLHMDTRATIVLNDRINKITEK